MPNYCPRCNKEILPYLRTGELKEVEGLNLISYQLYFCINCKVVYYSEHEKYEFLNLKHEQNEMELKRKLLNQITKEKKDADSDTKTKRRTRGAGRSTK